MCGEEHKSKTLVSRFALILLLCCRPVDKMKAGLSTAGAETKKKEEKKIAKLVRRWLGRTGNGMVDYSTVHCFRSLLPLPLVVDRKPS